MKFLLFLPVLITVGLAFPHSIEIEHNLIISNEDHPKNVIYEGEHDIVDIMVPLNRASIADSSESYSSELSHLNKNIIFFIEADIKHGQREDQGIYIYKNGKATKVMDNGSAIAASADDSEYVFLGAKDGLYVYNPKTQKADKYGNFNKTIKDMAKEQNTDAIYILTDERELYKTYDAATEKVKIDDVKDAEQIMMDYSNNLYYYGKEHKLYVRTIDGEIKTINDLPKGAKEVKLLRPPMFYNEGVGLMVDREIYIIYPDGKSELEDLEYLPKTKPTAYSMETVLFHYLGYNKKIYEFDLLSLIDSSESISLL